MDEGFTRTEKLAGLFLFLMLLIAVAAILAIGQGKNWFEAHQTYLIKFKQGYNLSPGSAVKMFNIEIGKVTKLHLSRVRGENLVVITIKVLAEYVPQIRQDSVAEVQSPGLFGSEYIGISPGTSGYPLIKEYGIIPSREHKTFAEYLEEFKPEESLRRARQILTNIAYLTEQLKTHERTLLASLEHFNQVLESVINAQGSLGKLLMEKDFYDRMAQAMSQLETIMKDAQTITGDLKNASGQMPALARYLYLELKLLKSILAEVKATTQELPPMAESASEAAQSGQEVMEALKANPLIRLTMPKKPQSRAIHVEPRDVP